MTQVADPLCMFSAIRVFVGGQLCEYFQDRPPLAIMMSRFKPVWRHIQYSMGNHPISPDDGSRLALAAGESRRLIISRPHGFLKQQSGRLFTSSRGRAPAGGTSLGASRPRGGRAPAEIGRPARRLDASPRGRTPGGGIFPFGTAASSALADGRRTSPTRRRRGFGR